MLALQDPPSEPEPAGLLERIAAEPALVQLVLLAVVGIAFWFLIGRLSRAVREARGRAAMRDFLLGVEQALHGDTKAAAARLSRVLTEDPENTTARLFYAQTLAELGEPGEAHKHHVQLARGFGVQSRRNQVALAQALLDSGRSADAVTAARAAVDQHAGELDAHRVLLRAQLAAGQPADAGETAQRLSLLLPSGAERERVRAEGARAFAMAAKVSLGGGDPATARRLLAQAAQCGGDLPEIKRVAAKLEWAQNGDPGLARHLVNLALPAPGESGGEADVHLPVRSAATPLALAAIAPHAAYACSNCGAPLPEPVPTCPHCGVHGSCRPTEPDLYRELDSPVHVIDAIEENRAHVQRLLQRAGSGRTEAADEIVEIGAPAVEETLARAVEIGPEDELFTSLLQRMGAEILPALFDAYRKRKDDWFQRFGEMLARRSSAAVVGRVVQSFGREALPQFEALLDSADRDLRKVIIDYYIGLADQAEFQKVLERFPPVEVVGRLNEAPTEVLQRFVSSVEAGSFQAEVLLVEPTFNRDADMFDSIDAREPGVVEEILARRGFSRATVRMLIDHLDDELRGAAAGRLLDQLGDRALDAQVSAYADLDRRATVRDRLRERLSRGGPRAAAELCECLAASPTPFDDDVLSVLVALGDEAVGPLVEAYKQGSMLEKFASAFVSRHSHRRSMIVRALAQIGSVEASGALQSLRQAETDSNLKLRLDQALHRLEAADDSDSEEDHGQAG